MFTFKLFPELYCYFHTDKVPDFVYSSNFYNINKGPTELSVFCEQSLVNETYSKDSNWKLLQLEGVFDLEAASSVGITAKFSQCLAAAGINLCVIATFDTDYLLIKEKNIQVACQILSNNNFTIIKSH
jgi:uncharacterized protein